MTFDVERASVRIGPVVLFKDGVPFDDRAPEAASYLAGTDLEIAVDLGAGGPALRHRLDVRPQRGVRGNQCGVSHLAA